MIFSILTFILYTVGYIVLAYLGILILIFLLLPIFIGEINLRGYRLSGVLAWMFFRKLLGLPWFYVALPFRGYSRNVVHNYVLQNDIYLPRLTDRSPTLIDDKDGKRYILKDIHNIKKGNPSLPDIEGFIKYRKITRIEYQLVFWILYGWMDDDSNHDTMSGWTRDGMVYGNSFDLGDLRAKYPEHNFKEAWLWLVRNTAYNFKYVLHEVREDSKYFFYKRYTKKVLGFSIDWHFGYIPYNNKRRFGRLVYFWEDIDKIDPR